MPRFAGVVVEVWLMVKKFAPLLGIAVIVKFKGVLELVTAIV